MVHRRAIPHQCHAWRPCSSWMALVLEVATDRQGWLCMNCVNIPSHFREPCLGQGGHGGRLYEWKRKVRHKYRRWYHADESARYILEAAGRNPDRPAARAAVACCVVEVANEVVRETGKYGGKDVVMKLYAHLCPFVGVYNAPPRSRVPPPLHPPPPPPLLVHVDLRDDVNHLPYPYPFFGFSDSDDDSDDDSDGDLMAI